MSNEHLTFADYGLIFLSNFREGLSYYNWDHGVIYNLKSKSHPNEILTNLKSRNLISSNVINGTKNFVLTDLGMVKVTEFKKRIEPVFNAILEIQNRLLRSEYSLEKIEMILPIYSFKYGQKRHKVILENNEEEQYLRVLVPSDTNEAINELHLSLNILYNSDYLEDILRASFKMIDKINYEDLS